jgi:integrase
VLDASTVAALREHRRRQAEERLQAGAAWEDHGLIFCCLDGAPLHPERFTRRFSARLHQLGLPPIRLHDLRHGWATMALAAGVHPKIVQERLGHANIGITLDIYSHVTATLHGEAAEKVADLVFRRS